MSRLFTQKETLAAVSRLSRTRLVSYIEAEIVKPVHTAQGPAFRQLDLARLELLCELDDLFGLQDEALCMVMSLIDQLHDARRDLRVVLEVVAEAGSGDLRRRIGRALRQS